MKKGFALKRKRILNISGIVVVILIVSVVGTKAATAIQSSMVTYNNTTVKETLDDLVDISIKGNATPEDIAVGKTAVVQGKLITGIKEEQNLGGGGSFTVIMYVSISASTTYNRQGMIDAGYTKLTVTPINYSPSRPIIIEDVQTLVDNDNINVYKYDLTTMNVENINFSTTGSYAAAEVTWS